MRWVRPDFTTVASSSRLRSSEAARCSSAGTRSFTTALVAAMWMLLGKTSLEDCEALTWSLGWTGLPSFSVARVASTSLVFMFDEVPEPVWKTSTGKWASQRPSATSAAASWIACGHLRLQDAEVGVDLRGRRLDAGERLDVGPLERLAADREVLHRPLGLAAVLRVLRDPHLAHRVVLDPPLLRLVSHGGILPTRLRG